MKANFDRPIEGTLHVVLTNGDSWEAGPDDLRKFGLVTAHEAYSIWDKHVTDVLSKASLLERGDLTRSAINPIRYMVEVAICYPDLLEHPEMSTTDEDLVTIESALRAAGYPEED
jgi:hypothetical protein